MKARKKSGFSIIELAVVVATIGIVALLGVPEVRLARDRTEATATANDLRVFTEAIEFYSTTLGKYPQGMSFSSVPPEISAYLPPVWENGQYLWLYQHNDFYTLIYVYNLGYTPEQALRIDNIIDDGNIATGRVRINNGGDGLYYLFLYPGL